MAGCQFTRRLRRLQISTTSETRPGQNLAGSVYQSGHRKAEEAAFYAELGYEEARDWARSHPSQALGIAAGIGLLLGIVVARR